MATGRLFAIPLDRFLGQHPDERKIAEALVEIESIAHNKFVGNVEPDIIGIDRPNPLNIFPQEHARAQAGHADLLSHALCDGVEGEPAVQDIIEDQYMAPAQAGNPIPPKIDMPARLRPPVACNSEALDLQAQRDPAKQIGHENKASVEDRDNGEFLAPVITGDSFRHRIQPAQNI